MDVPLNVVYGWYGIDSGEFDDMGDSVDREAVMHVCLRCSSLTESPVVDRCGRCSGWPEYDPVNPTVGDLAKLAEHLYNEGGWARVVTGLIDAQKTSRLMARISRDGRPEGRGDNGHECGCWGPTHSESCPHKPSEPPY